LIVVNGQVVGSSLIGQNFSADKYFQGRQSANKYDASNSTGSNLGPSSQTLINNVASAARSYRQANGLGPNDPVPVDAVTADFTGFDPDITEANALLQVNRVASSRRQRCVHWWRNTFTGEFSGSSASRMSTSSR
jgi:K+-transporting ATPase ATPase C chain